MPSRIFFAMVLPLILLITGCAPKYLRYVSSYHKNSLASKEPDYSNLDDWAAHPWKKDPSDSVPRPLRKGYVVDSSVDVFFIHPTTLTNNVDERWNGDINDAELNAKTDYTTILYQASVFNEFRVFAPRYRQAHLRSYYTTDTAVALRAFDTAYQDIKTAFQYYLLHYNAGKPIVIAAHSQGSTHALRLLREFFENRPLKKQLVVAYIVGMYIPKNYFTGLSMCRDSLATGCICGWRTYKKGYEPYFVLKEQGSGLVTNPLSGSNSEDYSTYHNHKGAVLRNFNKVTRHVTGAQIHDGVLWIDKLHIPGGFLIRIKNFHVGDINIFYINLRQDLKKRVFIFRKR